MSSIFDEVLETAQNFQDNLSNIVAISDSYQKEYELWYLFHKKDPALLKKYMKIKVVEALNEDIEP